MKDHAPLPSTPGTMGVRFVYTRGFDRQWANLGLGDEARRHLENQIAAAPDSGDVVQGTGGLRKIRLAIRAHQGKSGGGRVCYACFLGHGTIFMVMIFAKADQANITVADKPRLRAALKEFEESLDRGEV